MHHAQIESSLLSGSFHQIKLIPLLRQRCIMLTANLTGIGDQGNFGFEEVFLRFALADYHSIILSFALGVRVFPLTYDRSKDRGQGTTNTSQRSTFLHKQKPLRPLAFLYIWDATIFSPLNLWSGQKSQNVKLNFSPSSSLPQLGRKNRSS